MPSPLSQTKTGTQLARCVLGLKDLPAMSSCARLTHMLTNSPHWVSPYVKQSVGLRKSVPVGLPYESSLLLQPNVCPFFPKVNGCVLRLSLVTTYWKDLAADQSMTVLINSDADCFPPMRRGRKANRCMCAKMSVTDNMDPLVEQKYCCMGLISQLTRQFSPSISIFQHGPSRICSSQHFTQIYYGDINTINIIITLKDPKMLWECFSSGIQLTKTQHSEL